MSVCCCRANWITKVYGRITSLIAVPLFGGQKIKCSLLGRIFKGPGFKSSKSFAYNSSLFFDPVTQKQMRKTLIRKKNTRMTKRQVHKYLTCPIISIYYFRLHNGVWMVSRSPIGQHASVRRQWLPEVRHLSSVWDWRPDLIGWANRNS